MGMNTFRRNVFVLYPLFLVGPDFDIAHAHNEFLQAALDLGLPGLIAFLTLHIGAFWILFKIWRLAHTPQSWRLLVLGLGGVFAYMIYSLTDAAALGAKPRHPVLDVAWTDRRAVRAGAVEPTGNRGRDRPRLTDALGWGIIKANIGTFCKRDWPRPDRPRLSNGCEQALVRRNRLAR
jgi:hypothetical protein